MKCGEREKGEKRDVCRVVAVWKKKNVSHLRCLRAWGCDPVLTHWAKFWRAAGAVGVVDGERGGNRRGEGLREDLGLGYMRRSESFALALKS